MRHFLTSAAALLLLSGCVGAGASNDPVRGKPVDPQAQAQANLLAEVDGLKSQVQRLSAEMEELGMQLRALSEGDGAGGGTSLPELGRRIQKLEGAIRQMGSQLGVEVDGQQPAGPGVQPGLPGQPGSSMAPGGNGDEQARMASLPPGAQVPAVAPPAAQPPAAQPAARTDVPQAAPGADPAEAIYSKGMQAFQAKDYDKAIGLWGDVVRSYPKHSLAPNASFWLGEAYYQKNDWGQAVLNYNTVVEKFPKSNKAPSAMLKMGMAFQKLNKKDAARLMFQDVIKKYPDTAEAKRAKTLL